MSRLLAVTFLAVFALLSLSGSALAQNKKDKGPAERTVTGVVSDADGKPISGAVVQLENKKTLQIRSFISKENGEYVFNGLGTDVDYELTARSGQMASQKRTLSSFDTRKSAVVNLTVK